jgi:hypothetical protein
MTRKTSVTLLVSFVVTAIVLSSCGIPNDRVPRDIDPQKQEELNNP